MRKLLALVINAITFQFFASTLDDAIRYISEPEELERTLIGFLYTADLLDESGEFDGANTIKYQKIQFGSLVPGTYSFSAGYTQMDVHTTWETLTLTQDIGNSISVEKIADQDALGNGIVRFANRYMKKIQAPAVDTYRFAKIVGTSNIYCKMLTLTKDNFVAEILHAESRLDDALIDDGAWILYIKSGTKAIAKEAAVAKGYWALGNWNGNMDITVEMIDRCKLKAVPERFFPTGVQAILVHKDAAPAWNKYQETVIFDKIPGHGGRKLQADIGLKHDQFVYPELTRAIYAFKVTAATTYSVTFANGGGTGTLPTQAATAPDAEFVLPANPFTKTGYTFVGWSDGTHLYPAGFNYVMPGNAVTITAVWNAD